MNALLQSLLNLAGTTADQATAIWHRLCVIVAGLLFACFIVFLTNTLFGWHWPALILAMVFVPAAAFAWARPLFFLCVGIAGLAEKLASNATLAESTKDVFKAYSGVFKWATVAMVIYCFVMYFFSLNENSSMAVTALFALVVVGVCLWAWPELFPGSWARKTVYWGSVAVVICGLLSQIPAPYWVKYVGWAPSFAPTVAENMISDIRKAQANNKENADGKSLEKIHEKVLKGGTLTTAEESLVTKKEAEAKTVKALAGATVDRLSDPVASPSLTTVYGTAKKYWLWIVLVLAGLYFGFGAVSKPWAKSAKGMVIAVSVVLVGAMIVHGIWGEKSPSQQVTRSEVPLASSPQSSWPKLVIPANGKSERIPVPPGMRIVMAGNKFLLHNVYRDGNECSFNQSCPDVGAVAGNYATNEAQETNIVAYAFAPI